MSAHHVVRVFYRSPAIYGEWGEASGMRKSERAIGDRGNAGARARVLVMVRVSTPANDWGLRQ